MCVKKKKKIRELFHRVYCLQLLVILRYGSYFFSGKPFVNSNSLLETVYTLRGKLNILQMSKAVKTETTLTLPYIFLHMVLQLYFYMGNNGVKAVLETTRKC